MKSLWGKGKLLVLFIIVTLLLSAMVNPLYADAEKTSVRDYVFTLFKDAEDGKAVTVRDVSDTLMMTDKGIKNLPVYHLKLTKHMSYSLVEMGILDRDSYLMGMMGEAIVNGIITYDDVKKAFDGKSPNNANVVVSLLRSHGLNPEDGYDFSYYIDVIVDGSKMYVDSDFGEPIPIEKFFADRKKMRQEKWRKAGINR